MVLGEARVERVLGGVFGWGVVFVRVDGGSFGKVMGRASRDAWDGAGDGWNGKWGKNMRCCNFVGELWYFSALCGGGWMAVRWYSKEDR